MSVEVIINIRYTSKVKQIYVYLVAIINPTFVSYIILRYKEINTKNKKKIEVKGLMLLGCLKKEPGEKLMEIYVNEEQHLPYW